MATSVDLPDGLEKALTSELEEGIYKNKSEVIRDAVRRLLEEKGKIENRRLSAETVEAVREARKAETFDKEEVFN